MYSDNTSNFPVLMIILVIGVLLGIAFGVGRIMEHERSIPVTHDKHIKLLQLFRENDFLLGQAIRVTEDGIISKQEYRESMALYSKLVVEHFHNENLER